MMGLQFQTDVDGEDISACVLHPEKPHHRCVYLYSYVPCHQAQNRKIASWRALTDGNTLLAADENSEILALFTNRDDPLQMHNQKDDARHAATLAKWKAKLDQQVQIHDGYIPWQELLKKNQLDDLWNESDAFFEKYFTRLRKQREKADVVR